MEYKESDYIETAKEDFYFGHRKKYKYRVLNINKDFTIHHTNSLEDAKWYFNECLKHWINNK